MVWISSITLLILITGLMTVGVFGIRLPKRLIAPIILAGFLLTLGFLFSYLALNASDSDVKDFIMGGTIKIITSFV